MRVSNMRRMTLTVLAGTSVAALLLSCAGANAARADRRADREQAAQAGSGEQARGLQSIDIQAGGRARNYLLYVPSSYRSGAPTPLVLVFHGGGDNAGRMAESTRYGELAEREGFIVAFPNGTFGKRANGGTWNTGSGKGWGSAEKKGVNDLAFVRGILDDIKGEFSIDRDRVFVTGMSKGAMMTYTIACNMSDEIAAIAPVAGTLIAARCEPTSPVAVFHVHGTGDRSVPLNGGVGDKSGGGYDYPPVSRGIEKWRSRDRCSAEKSETRVGPETTCQTWKGCARDVTLCLVDRGGHAWPGQAPQRWQKAMKVYVTQSFDATQETWRYFEQHPKQR